MLTSNDLAIVRAALQFLDEEFSPGDDELLKCYLDEVGLSAAVGTSHIKETRAKFGDAKLYLAFKRVDQDELVSNHLVRLPTSEERAYQADKQLPVAVLEIKPPAQDS